MDKAVIYCRVSTKRQTKEGDGLASQATRCREFARYRNLEVVEVFQDSQSGSLIDRPGMQAMLKYLRAHRRDNLTVIIDDLSRLARGVEAHIHLRTAISSVGARLASPSIEFGEDSDSVLVEHLLASVSQHHRQKNAEQTRNRRRARMLNGYWVHFAPIGYKYASKPGHGKILVRDEPLASIVAEGLEGYASGRFQIRAEVKRFFEQFPEFPTDAKGEVSNEHVNRILSRVIYAGHIQSDIMDVSLRPAHNEPLISLETYQKIQQRMQEKPKIATRKDLNEDFPLRGAVHCSDCDHPLTACWTKGRSKHYPYYYCFTKGCESYGKAIAREKLEGEFVNLLHKLEPSPSLFRIATKMFETWWRYRQAQIAQRGQSFEREIRKLDDKIEQLMDRLVEADSQTMVKAYEKRVRQLETDKAVLVEKSGQSMRPMRSFDAALRTALEFISNPHKLWDSGRLCDRRAVLKLAFPGGFKYHRNTGLRTTETPLPFKVLGEFMSKKIQMAEKAGFEPAVRFEPYTRFPGVHLKPLGHFSSLNKPGGKNKLDLSFGQICFVSR